MADEEGKVADLTAARSRADAKKNGHDPDKDEQARKSIEDLAGEGDGVEDEEGQYLLDFGDQLNLSLKGKRPTRSQIKIRPVSRDISGQLGDKGDDETYGFLLVGRLHKLEMPIERDDAGRVTAKTRRHVIDPHDVQRLPDEVIEIVYSLVDLDEDGLKKVKKLVESL